MLTPNTNGRWPFGDSVGLSPKGCAMIFDALLGGRIHDILVGRAGRRRPVAQTWKAFFSVAENTDAGSLHHVCGSEDDNVLIVAAAGIRDVTMDPSRQLRYSHHDRISSYSTFYLFNPCCIPTPVYTLY